MVSVAKNERKWAENEQGLVLEFGLWLGLGLGLGIELVLQNQLYSTCYPFHNPGSHQVVGHPRNK